MFEKFRAALYAVLVALNTLALTFGWYSEAQGVALLGVANAVLLAVAFVNVPWIHGMLRKSNPVVKKATAKKTALKAK